MEHKCFLCSSNVGLNTYKIDICVECQKMFTAHVYQLKDTAKQERFKLYTELKKEFGG